MNIFHAKTKKLSREGKKKQFFSFELQHPPTFQSQYSSIQNLNGPNKYCTKRGSGLQFLVIRLSSKETCESSFSDSPYIIAIYF